jgi:hypothetical protein
VLDGADAAGSGVETDDTLAGEDSLFDQVRG